LIVKVDRQKKKLLVRRKKLQANRMHAMDKTRAARHAEDKGSAAQNEGGTGPFEELEALMIQWRLETHAAVFIDLGVETVADLEYMQDSDVDALQIPKIAKRKMQSLLDWWRGQNTAASTQKSTKRHRVDPPGVAGGAAGRAVGGSAEGAGGHAGGAGGAGGDESSGDGSDEDDSIGDGLPLQTLRRFEVFVKTMTGATTTLNVCSSDTIVSVKSKFSVEEGPLEGAFDLIYSGTDEESATRWLADAHTLGDYGVERFSTLHVIPFLSVARREGGTFYIIVKGLCHRDRVRRCAEVGRSYLLFALQVNSSNTVEVLRSLIQDRESQNPDIERGGSAPPTLITYKDELLQHGRTLAYYCIDQEPSHLVVLSRRRSTG
jgi:hypothetical protein